MPNKFHQFLLLLLFSLSLTSCFKQNETKEVLDKPDPNNVLVYFIKVDKDDYSLKSLKYGFDLNGSKLKQALDDLLRGPSDEERKIGFGTEIPVGTKLLSLVETKEKITINLSEQFISGGGSASMQLRYKQLFKTIALNAPDKPVYVLVEGKDLKILGGEGLVTDSPISKGNLTGISVKDETYEL